MTLASGKVLYGSSQDGALRSVAFGGGAVAGAPSVVSNDGTWKYARTVRAEQLTLWGRHDRGALTSSSGTASAGQSVTCRLPRTHLPSTTGRQLTRSSPD